MITSVKQAKQILKEFNAIKTDLGRLKYIKDHSTELKVVLDNDLSMVNFNLISVDDDVQEEAISELDSQLNNFDEYHGWGEGNVLLFKFAGIDAEAC